MAYSHTSLAQAEAQLAARLTEPLSAAVRYPADELDYYILEALRCWNALTGFYQTQSDPFIIPAGAVFTDIPASLPSLCGYTLRDQDIVGQLQYHLFERKNVSGWSGTEMFTLADLTAAIQRRRNQFLLDTDCRITRYTFPDSPDVINAGDETYALPESVIDVRRVAWTTLSGRTSPLWQTSNFSLRAANPNWNLDSAAEEVPRTFNLNERAPVVVQLGPPPQDSGTLDMLTVNSGATLDPATGSGVLLGIPDDFVWVVKWGALADLLSKDGPARDYARSLFCERRYQLGVAAAKVAGMLIDVRLDGRTAQFSSVQALDMGVPFWQNVTGAPVIVASAGMNLFALYPPPAANVNVELTLTRNAPIPATSAEFIQIGKEYLDIILGYAEHLAMFKIAGTEFAATTHLAQSFFTAAEDFNDKLRAAAVFEDDEKNISRADEKAKPRRVGRVTGASVGTSSSIGGGA